MIIFAFQDRMACAEELMHAGEKKVIQLQPEQDEGAIEEEEDEEETGPKFDNKPIDSSNVKIST